jgi:tetratricopeptide (TPR) repeat protein
MLNDLSLGKNFTTLVFIFVAINFSNLCWSQVQTSSSPTQISQFSEEIENTRELIVLGRLKEAQEKISTQLKIKPRDAQWRYLNAVLLAEFAIINQNSALGDISSNKLLIEKAIESFERFTEEFPELSEPYNNLAVLYLMRGQPDRSREALEKAVINNPNYELGYENLGDLYIYLANTTYKKGFSKSPKSSRLNKKLDHLSQMPFLTKPNITSKFKKK